MGQPVVHWELWSEDPPKISDFYQKVFGWQIRAIPELNYRLVETVVRKGSTAGS
jgi:predicted enzyme related to lactoylglutathione lyase